MGLCFLWLGFFSSLDNVDDDEWRIKNEDDDDDEDEEVRRMHRTLTIWMDNINEHTISIIMMRISIRNIITNIIIIIIISNIYSFKCFVRKILLSKICCFECFIAFVFLFLSFSLILFFLTEPFWPFTTWKWKKTHVKQQKKAELLLGRCTLTQHTTHSDKISHFFSIKDWIS